MTTTITVDELRKFAETFVALEPGRLGADGWWLTPLLATAPVDSRFDQLPQITADDHVLPRDLLASARSVIVFYIPFKKDLVKENRRTLDYFVDLPESTHVCGKCVALMPCSFKNPVALLDAGKSTQETTSPKMKKEP